MALIKKEKTPAQIAEHENNKRLGRVRRSLVTQVCNNCKDQGLKAVEYKLEFLKGHPKTQLPTELNYETTLACFEEGIKKYKEGGGLDQIKNQTSI